MVLCFRLSVYVILVQWNNDYYLLLFFSQFSSKFLDSNCKFIFSSNLGNSIYSDGLVKRWWIELDGRKHFYRCIFANLSQRWPRIENCLLMKFNFGLFSKDETFLTKGLKYFHFQLNGFRAFISVIQVRTTKPCFRKLSFGGSCENYWNNLCSSLKCSVSTVQSFTLRQRLAFINVKLFLPFFPWQSIDNMIIAQIRQLCFYWEVSFYHVCGERGSWY